MASGTSARGLLRQARVLYDDPSWPLARAAAQLSWRDGFAGGAGWMRLALQQLREVEPQGGAQGFQRLGAIKYALALGAALLCCVAAGVTARWTLLAGAVPAFYAVEAQMVFLFPLALDGVATPFRESRRWTAQAGGTLRVMAVVLPIAAVMLLGGFARQGFVRCWALGCLAVVLWYERLREEAPHGAA